MEPVRLLGFDFGASSGRAMLGELGGEHLTLKEVHRFSNDPVKLNGRWVWDIQRLFYHMLEALKALVKQGISIDGIGIDTWGVDFGFLDADGKLIGIPAHYRDSRTDGMMERAFEMMPKETIFQNTGLAFMSFNTLYQLLAMKESGDKALQIADKLLFLPDLLMYFLTGNIGAEYTIASTSQLIDPHTRDWSEAVLKTFGFERSWFPPITAPGTVRGRLSPDICRETGMGDVPVIAVAGHDTASAVAAVPAPNDDFAYLSSGTWSLLGAEIKAPLTDVSVLKANYTNEGGVEGTTRLLKNIMGLWMVQECKREWDKREDAVDFDGLVARARGAEPFIAVLDVDDPRFMAPGEMPKRIAQYCRETGQRVPEGRGEICRVIYESLALKYRWAIERLEQDMLKRPVKALNIVGGGSKNELLNQFAADAMGRPVYAGPAEATAIGNVLVQAMALEKIDSLKALRAVVRNSFEIKTYTPCADRGAWDQAYGRLCDLVN